MLQQEYIDSLLNCLLRIQYIDGMIAAENQNGLSEECRAARRCIANNIAILSCDLKDLYNKIDVMFV